MALEVVIFSFVLAALFSIVTVVFITRWATKSLQQRYTESKITASIGASNFGHDNPGQLQPIALFFL